MDVGDEELQAPSGHAAGRGGRDDRLAAALRTNLAKRKEQGRARARHSAGTVGVNDLKEMRTRAWRRPQSDSAGQTEHKPHDSAEFIAEKSTDQAN